MNSLRDSSISVTQQLKCFGFNRETVEMVLGPMVNLAYEALGSMGNDAALACLSSQPHSVFDFFQQMFAQVTNPPIDPIREEIVMSLQCPIGPEGNLLDPSNPEISCRRVLLEKPVLGPTGFYNLTHLKEEGWEPAYVDITWPRSEGAAGLERALLAVCDKVEAAVRGGAKLLVLSDRGFNKNTVAVPSLMAVGAAHQRLVKTALRSRVGLIIESGDACEVHHHCLLTGFGVDAIYPYTVFDAAEVIQATEKTKIRQNTVVTNYLMASHKGMLKVFAKMGISTLQSYKGAQIFEAVGVGSRVIDLCFTRCASRIGGLDFENFADDVLAFHAKAFPANEENEISNNVLGNPGTYHWRNAGTNKNTEVHLNHPDAIAALQEAARSNSNDSYQKFANITNALNGLCTIRGQLGIKKDGEWDPIPLEKVEPASEIVKRFASGAMSYGSISIEAHSTLAVAMNRVGARSNTGEGGEHISRYSEVEEHNSARSAIKQVASGRFGVTIHYLTNADEIQIKMAQGAKPGEGGELPGYKVVGEIAKTRMSTEGVGLISPPPHHDIYSIEDLAQLIFDCKNANPGARISVKLVSEVGVGVIAAGVAKGMADHILISGHDGGTGASKWTGIKHAGLPFELGIAEAHQVLVKNGLRSRVVLQTDGQLKTGLDILKAAMLGAEEFCLATAPLIAMGCIMMRKCHLNTCPVGIASQDPYLRKQFAGQPEHVMNYLFMMAEEVRGYMAALGIPTFNELVGRADLLEPVKQNRVRTRGLDLSALLVNASTLNPGHPMICTEEQDHGIANVLDRRIIERIGADVKANKKVKADFFICNTDRTVGTILSHEVTKLYGLPGLPEDQVHLRLKGSAGQSFGAFLAPGITMELNGDANDYVGKGLSGGNIVVYPPRDSNFKAEENLIIGNVCLYGATSGKAFFRGKASQRFCVRNSGAKTVVEGCGDHCCEYMTGGVVVVLGKTGRNFGAGMSGGIAYVYDGDNDFEEKVNMGLVQLEKMVEKDDIAMLRDLVDEHRTVTGSAVADKLLWNWEESLKKFVKVIPTDYKRVLEQQAKQALLGIVEEKYELPVIGTVPTKDVEDMKVPAPRAPRPVGVPNPNKRRGFIEYDRRAVPYRKPEERVGDFKEIYTAPDQEILKTQASRCMDCGVPFCHQESTGCPLGNKIPEWNELVFQGKWKEALERLHETNNFPEFTGRACPAPCEGACVLGITEDPVTIKNIENSIIDKGFEMGWVLPVVPTMRSGKKVAVIGSGPAGLACAAQLNKAGHLVTVFERSDRPGGLLMYGVPNQKLDKKDVVERRLDIMRSEGIVFKCNVSVGKDIKATQLCAEFDAVVMATGSTKARSLPVPGSDLKGVELAMDYLHPVTKSLLDSKLRDGNAIDASDKRVIVIGGGDTGNDCIGTAARQGAKSVVNFELLPKPPKGRAAGNPWPQWPLVHRQNYGHEEVKTKHGTDPRHFSVLTKKFLDDGAGRVAGVETVQIRWDKDPEGRWLMQEIEGSQQTFKADLVFLAMGFTGPELSSADDVGLEVTRMGNYKAAYGLYKTSVDKVFACGDCRRGQSLIVWGIAEGRQCAREVDSYLMGSSTLP
jgi:glutamate synthase (NADPH/NADH)